MRELVCKPSWRLRLWLGGLVVLALVAVARAALPTAVQGALTAATLALAVRSGRRMTHLPALRLLADGRLQGRDADDVWHALEVAGDSFVSPHLVVLRYRLEGGPVRTLTLMADSLPADDWRRLRVSLRWIPRTRSDTASPDGG